MRAAFRPAGTREARCSATRILTRMRPPALSDGTKCAIVPQYIACEAEVAPLARRGAPFGAAAGPAMKCAAVPRQGDAGAQIIGGGVGRSRIFSLFITEVRRYIPQN